jgi:hypothetical protein
MVVPLCIFGAAVRGALLPSMQAEAKKFWIFVSPA